MDAPAAQEGFEVVRAVTLPSNRAARRLARRLGLVRRGVESGMYRFERRLAGAAA
jgi:RimJ/RimL family protein N-acetyltransferase